MNLFVVAYIDPMAGSLVLQAVIAGVVGVLFTFRQFGIRLWSLLPFHRSQAAQGEGIP